MRAVAVAFAFALLAGGAACVELNGRPTRASNEPAKLRVTTVPENARVVVDEVVLDGRVIAVEPVSLPPGRHLVTVQAEGYFPHDLALDLPSGETAVTVRLRRLPP